MNHQDSSTRENKRTVEEPPGERDAFKEILVSQPGKAA